MSHPHDVEHKPEVGDHHEGLPPHKIEQDVIPEKVLATDNGDLSARWLADYGGAHREISDEEQTRVRWTIDRRILPIIFYIYFTQQLDKSSLSYTSVFGLQKDTHLVGQEYSWLSSIVYFAQLVCQPLSVWALVKIPVNIWISVCFVGWGACCMLLGAVHNFAGLAVFRFFLGAFEASIAPSMLILVSMWWTRREQPLRNNIWYSANGIAAILGSLLTYGLGHANTTSLHTYQLIFLVNGAIAVALSIPTFFLLPSHPTKVKWLNDDQKYIALERIRMNNTGTRSSEFKWSQVRECFLDIKQWIFMIIIFCISLVSGGIGAFGPLILAGYGLNQFQTILYNMIPGAIGIVSNIATALIIMKVKIKSIVIFGALCFPLAGAAALYAIPHTTANKQKLLAVYFIFQVFGCITPLILSWAMANTAGHTKKTTTTGMLFVGLTVGNIVGPQLYKADQAPLYRTGLQANLGCICAIMALVIIQTVYLTYLNKRNVARRRASGKTGRVVDYSLEASSKWASLRSEQATQDQNEVHHQEQHNAQAFLDLTDLQNHDFIYSL